MAYISKLPAMKIFCFILFQASFCYSQTLSLLEAFEKNENTSSINVSYAIINLETDSLVYSHNANKVFPPASTLKLVSTGTALLQLGHDFKYNTIFKTNGAIKADTLFGDILIEASGDPTFGSKRLNYDPVSQLINVLKQKNVNFISGKIFFTNTKKIDTPLSWPLGDVGNYYGAFPQNFNFNENSFSVYFNSQKALNENSDIGSMFPDMSNYKITNKVSIATSNTGDNVYILSLPMGNEIMLTGTIPQYRTNFEVKGSIPNIEVSFKELLYRRFLNEGIRFIEVKENANLNAALELSINTSPELKEIIKLCNFSSINFYADALANKLTNLNNKDSIDKMLKDFWHQNNLNLNAFTFIDGSGLSPQNAISTFGMASFLSKMYKNENFNYFKESIPVVGKTGTVARIDRNNKTKGRVHAKSGSIGGVRNYAGYFYNKNNQLCSFAIFSNGFNDSNEQATKKFLEDFLTGLIDLNQ